MLATTKAVDTAIEKASSIPMLAGARVDLEVRPSMLLIALLVSLRVFALKPSTPFVPYQVQLKLRARQQQARRDCFTREQNSSETPCLTSCVAIGIRSGPAQTKRIPSSICCTA